MSVSASEISSIIKDKIAKSEAKIDVAQVGKVLSVGDYSTGETKNIVSGKSEPITQPKSDVLYYTLENEDKIIFRPSGTEPKIKIYILAHADGRRELESKVKEYEKDAKRIIEK